MRTIYYHGSSRSWRPALEARSASLRAGDTRTDDTHLMPMRDHVYVTPNPETAFKYMTMRQRWPEYRGAVLEIDTGTRFLIDEDCVGQALAIYYRLQDTDPWESGTPMRDRVKGACGFSFHDAASWNPDRVAKEVRLLEGLATLAERVVSRADLGLIRKKSATVRTFAKVGKVLSPVLPAALRDGLMRLGANLAVPSPAKVIGGWVFEGLPNQAGSGAAEVAFGHATYVPNVTGGRNHLPPTIALLRSNRRARKP